MYKVKYEKSAIKDLSKMSKDISSRIVDWMDYHIDNSDDPFRLAKRLTGGLNEYYRYRVGKYRVVCRIEQDKLIVTAISVVKREDVYRKFRK